MLWSAVRCMSWDNASQASGCGGPRRVGTERRSGAAPTRDADKVDYFSHGKDTTAERKPKQNLPEARNLLGAALANVLG